jgi:hypothetical protein
MKIHTIGAIFIGGVLFASGIAVLASNIDPSVLCFKQCDIKRFVIATFGRDVARTIAGASLAGVGALFLIPVLCAALRKLQD